MNLSPQQAPLRQLGARVEAQVPETARPPVRDIRVRMLAPAVVFVPASREVSFLFTESFPREASRTDLQLTTLS